MNSSDKKKEKELARAEAKKLRRKKKKNALVVCHDGKQFWTTQQQFWQWVRESVVIKLGDAPLTGKFMRENEEYDVVISNTVLNLRCPNHLSEALYLRNRALN